MFLVITQSCYLVIHLNNQIKKVSSQRQIMQSPNRSLMWVQHQTRLCNHIWWNRYQETTKGKINRIMVKSKRWKRNKTYLKMQKKDGNQTIDNNIAFELILFSMKLNISVLISISVFHFILKHLANAKIWTNDNSIYF